MYIDFNKSGGLVPVIIQHDETMQVLMLGYMNEEAYKKTVSEKIVTFFSRSKNALWTKGETSGNFLRLVEVQLDCDCDTLLIKVIPEGPVCHKGTFSCFGSKESKGFLYEVEETIDKRINEDVSNSYTNQLYKKGVNKIAQKVGEEAVELILEAKDDDLDLFKNEAADLLYHLLILLKYKNVKLEDIEEVLVERNNKL
jgi:phosphoribosyl-AMP cyclohydrolase / phosphoribosyl-ATP pyrophosphohydrolase